jgi:hypothetical protein
VTYAELNQLLQDFLENSETSFVSNIPTIVNQAENRIYHTVNTPDQRLSETGALLAGEEVITCPAAFLEPEALFMTIDGERRPLLQKQLSWLRTVYQYNDAGFPAHYCLSTAGSSSTTIIVGPIPSAYATYELYYFGNPTSVVTAGSTWLSVQFPEALLYGSLLEGYVYMKGEKDMRDTFQERFDRAMQSLKQSVDVQQLNDEYRNSPPAREVQ